MDLPAHGDLYKDSALTQMLSANTFVLVNQPLYLANLMQIGAVARRLITKPQIDTGAVSSSATATLNVFSAVADAAPVF
jgi:hypothetical protein